MEETQEQMKPKEREIPVFTVLKNDCILKNIFLLDKPPSISSSEEDADRESEIGEILMVGRHPDCTITLEHPSISRFHLRIHSKPSSRSLFVTDLSSVHGTWVSGRRLEPGVLVKLNEGDTLHLGASSRMYRLNWVPFSRAYDIDDPFVPELNALDTVDDETDEVTDQDHDSVSCKKNEGRDLSEDVEGQEGLLSMQKMSPIAPPMPEDLYRSFSNEDEEEGSGLPEIYSNENQLSSSQMCRLDTSVTVGEETEGTTDQLSSSQLCRLDTKVTVGEETEGTTDQDGVSSHSGNDEEKGLTLYDFFAEKDVIENNESPECNKENSIPQAHFPSDKMSVHSIWSKRAKPKSVGVETSKSRGNCERVNTSLQVESLFDGDCLNESMLKDQFESCDNAEEIYDKENASPDSCLVRALKCEFEETLKVESISHTPVSSVYRDEEIFTPNKENVTQKSHLFNFKSMKSVRKSEEVEHPKSYSVDQDKEIFTPDKENVTPKSHLYKSMKSVRKSGEVEHPKSYSVDQDEEIFTPDKENATPKSHLFKSMKSVRKSGEAVHPKSYSVDQDEEIFTPDKENVTPKSHLFKSMKSIRKSGEAVYPKSYSVDQDEEMFNPDKENVTPKSHLFKSLKSVGKFGDVKHPDSYSVDQDEETFTPDKENVTPNSHLFKSMKNRKSGEVKHPKSYRPSPLKVGNNSNVYQESKSVFSISKSHGGLKKKQSVFKARPDREPFNPLLVESTGDRKAKSHTSTMKVQENRWTIIADTTSLLNRKSRKELQLLRGLRGTTLVIPRIVVRELDCKLKRASFFSRMTEASAALNWIEECMAATKWWIHVQSSAEEGSLVPPTPPAAAASPHWFSEDKSVFSIGSIPFSPYSLQEIVTPTAADHILDCALLFRQIRGGQLVLLSDDVALKIKAMAEGVICETAEEFRRSVVNPFSPRFLYSNSTPIGPAWSCSEDTVLKENYYPSPSKKTGDCAKGLKLILLHNSNFRQMTN